MTLPRWTLPRLPQPERPTTWPGAAHLPRRLWTGLSIAALLALMQQQILLRRPPRLLELVAQGNTSGPGALDLRFSRPMQRASVAARSHLEPPLAHRWLGAETTLRLRLLPDQVLQSPLQLQLAGLDRREQPLPPLQWWWDPRPHLLVVARVPGGEQLQLRSHDGRWQPLSPVWSRIATVEPLANGRGVVFLAVDRQGQQRLWLRALTPRSLARERHQLGTPRLGVLRQLLPEALSYGHLSSNRRGDLLVQTARSDGGAARTLWFDPGGRVRQLPLQVSGPIELLSDGDGMVVPTPDGLELRSLQTPEARPQVLPGSRVLAAFCPASGQAVLVRHWPDYRRSLERVQPGSAPITLWIGEEAVMAAGCDPAGDRIWMLLNRWQGASRNSVVRLDRRGQIVGRRLLQPWEPEPGTPMLHDPVTDQLLLTLRRDPRQSARVGLLDADTLQLRLLPAAVSQAFWLPPG
ncbi:MAG: hypothetical protein ACKOXO_11390 [Cyanobium sp.]